jgi:hypothetical protein
MYKEYEPTKEELSCVPLDTISIPADIPSVDVLNSEFDLMVGCV